MPRGYNLLLGIWIFHSSLFVLHFRKTGVRSSYRQQVGWELKSIVSLLLINHFTFGYLIFNFSLHAAPALRSSLKFIFSM